MSIRKITLSMLLLSWFACLGPVLAAADEPPVDAEAAAAMKVLARRVGTWDDEVTIKPSKWVPAGGRIKRTTTFKMIQNGRFLHGEGVGTREQGKQAPTETVTIWITYSVQRRAYLHWFFSSVIGDGVDSWNGPVSVFVGQWNERSQTFSFELLDKETGINVTASTHWIDDDHTEWDHVVKNDKGEVLYEQSGKSTRRKEK